MKIAGINGCLSLACILFITFGTAVYGGTMGTESTNPTGDIYIGAFGGGGDISRSDLSQQGSAFFDMNSGGPLAVNASGESSSSSVWVVGGHVGYLWPSRMLNHTRSNWTVAPATELEGYYIGGSILRGEDVNNGTTRLRWSRYLVIDLIHPWIKSTRQRAKFLAATVLRPSTFALNEQSVCLPQ